MVGKRLLLVVLGTCVALLLAEMGIRAWFEAYGSETDRIRYVYSRADIRQRRARLTGVPYLVYGLTPGYPTQNRRGLRGPDVVVPKPAGVFRIIAVGGSTTYGDHIDRWEDAYPAQLEGFLRDRHRAVEVINAGVPGYASWELLISLAFKLLDLQPDLLIVYEGINDLYPRLVKPSEYDGLATSKGIWRTEAPALPTSVLYRVLAVRSGWIVDPSLAESHFDRSFSAEYCQFNSTYTRCDNFDMTPEAVLAANPPRYFERNLRNFVTLARANGIQVMLSSWAYYPTAIPEMENGRFMSLRFVQQAVAEHNGLGRKIAAEEKVPYCDLAASLPLNRAYWVEGMHLTPEGARQQASVYANCVIEARLIP
jgi:lysophospholipase L1-like esterase